MAIRPTTQTPIETGRRVFTNLKYLYFTPWLADGTEIGETTYNLISIVGDTTSLEQEDNEVNEIPHEFSKEPLYETVNLGNRTFTAECLDFQNDVLKSLFGWKVDGAGNAFAPNEYKDLYCAIEMGFNSTDDIVILPKVKLNSKAVLSSMKTDASRGTITGTCYAAYVKAGATTLKTDMAAIKEDSVATLEISGTGTETEVENTTE